MTIANKVASNTSRFSSLYSGALKAWCQDLGETEGIIVAIARKGPRLLELLLREQFLPTEVLNRVVSEHALPFCVEFDGNVTVVDDAVQHGSTFTRICKLTQEVYQERGGKQQVVGLPFAAVPEKITHECMNLIQRYHLSLAEDQAVSFVASLVSGLRLLGKPFDLEYPMISLIGDFSQTTLLHSALTGLTQRLGGKLIDLGGRTATIDGAVEVLSWTLLCPQISVKSDRNPLFSKLRIYLDPDLNRLNIVGMSPYSIAGNHLDDFVTCLPDSLKDLWIRARSICIENSSGLINTVTERSLQ
jgi:hypothetical protein